MNSQRALIIEVTAFAWPQIILAQTNPPVPPDRDIPVSCRVEVVASRLQAPWSVVFMPDGRMFFSERPGRVRVMENNQLLDQLALMLPDVVLGVKWIAGHDNPSRLYSQPLVLPCL